MTKKGLTQLILSVLLVSAFGPITYVAKSADTSTATTSTPTPTPTPTATSTPRTETTTSTTPTPTATSTTATNTCATQGVVNRPDWDSVGWTEYCRGNQIFDILFVIQGGKQIRVVGNGSSVSASDVPSSTATTSTPRTETTTATTSTPRTETTTATISVPSSETSTSTSTSTSNGLRIIATSPSSNGQVKIYWCFNVGITSGWVDWSQSGGSGSGSWLSFRNPCPAVSQQLADFIPQPGKTYSYSLTVKAMGETYNATYSFAVAGLLTTYDTKTVTTQTDTKTVTTKTQSLPQSETRTAQIAEVALISNTKERTVATVELIKTYSSAEKEQALDVTYKSKKSSVIEVDLSVPGIPVVITATKKGSPTITLKSTTGADGDAQIKTTKNLEGYAVALTVNKTKIDTDVVKKKK